MRKNAFSGGPMPRAHRHYFLITLSLLISISLVSCNETTEDKLAGDSTEAIQENRNPIKHGIYPHSLEFTITAGHGISYKENRASCTICHGDNLKGGKSKVSCLRCHSSAPNGEVAPIKNDEFSKNYPHSLDFKVSEIHGKLYNQNENSCKLCHGEDLQGGPSKISCGRCHTEYATTRNLSMRQVFRETKGYPHSFSFKIGSRHGKKYKRSPKTCQKCHGEKLDGGRSQVGCSNCHLDFDTTNQFSSNTAGLIPQFYPHELDFKISNKHGLAYDANPGKCQQCHGKELDGGPSKVSCTQCHIGGVGSNSSKLILVHSKKFKNEDHGKMYLINSTSCVQCHKIDSDKGIEQSSCKKCHDFPHPTFWSKPDAHGTNYLKEAKNEAPKMVSCINCHGHSEFSEVAVISNTMPIGCDKCHINMPHPKKFRRSRKHGNLDATEYNSCTKCHTDLVRLLPGTEADGNNTDLKGCYYCHNYDDKPDIFTFTFDEGEFTAGWVSSDECSVAMAPPPSGNYVRKPASQTKKCRSMKDLKRKRKGKLPHEKINLIQLFQKQ
jgi:hypothetical protein